MVYLHSMNAAFRRSLLVIMAALPCLAMADTGGAAPTPPKRSTARLSSSERALKQKLDEFSIDGIPFKDAINMLRDASGANFFVKWSVLEQAGVDPEAPVTVKVKGTTLAKTLQLILDSVEQEGLALGYYVHENVITISVSHTVRTDLVTRVYDITDLMYRIPDLSPGSANNNGGSQSGNNSGTGGSTGGGVQTSSYGSGGMRRN